MQQIALPLVLPFAPDGHGPEPFELSVR